MQNVCGERNHLHVFKKPQKIPVETRFIRVCNPCLPYIVNPLA
jgi:hypothetical protein